MTLNLFDLVVQAYWPIINIFREILNGGKPNTEKIPMRFTLGGSRVGGKTRTIFIFALLYSLAFPNSFVLIQVKKGTQKEDVWKVINDFIDNLLYIRGKVKRSLKSPMDIKMNNNSIICIRSLLTVGSDDIALKGLPRLVNLKKALIISEECNSFNSNKFFTPAREAIVAEEILEFNIFNTDHINQFVVKNMQDNFPEDEKIMRTIGNMFAVKKINGIWEYFQRTNTLVTWNVLPLSKKQQIIADDLADPIRGRVARWGLNGRDGKFLFYNLRKKHFVKTENINWLKRFEILPYELFKKYRIGIDEGHANDKFALVLWGITNYNRAIRLDKMVITPPKNGDLDIQQLALNSVDKIKYWSFLYKNMNLKKVNIRVEYAGNGVAILQEMKRELYNLNINYTIDKAKKTINEKTRKKVQGNKDTQPNLEARAAIKNLLFGRNQILFWNSDIETYNEYTGRTRDEKGLIVDGDDHEGDADDYALIPEYNEMLENPPKTTFKEEITEFLRSY